MTLALPDAEQTLVALADRMRPHVTADTALVGIHTGGVWIAERLHAMLGIRQPLGTIDVSFYRDDFDKRGLSRHVNPSTIPVDVTQSDLILVDDVLYTGRTIRAAMNELFDYGRPGRIRLAALIDRGGRQLPISAQFVGATVEMDGPGVIELRRGDDGRFSLALTRP